MKRVYKSKEPSVNQMTRMAANLERKLGQPAKVQVEVWKMSQNDGPSIYYQLYLLNEKHEEFDNWPELQDRYFSIMKDGI